MDKNNIINPEDFGIVIEDKSKIIELKKDDVFIEKQDENEVIPEEQLEEVVQEIIKGGEKFLHKKETGGNSKQDAKKSKNTKKNKSLGTSTEANNKNESRTKNKNESRTKNDFYYIKVKYPDETFIKITAPDKTNFKESKDLYHKTKEEYKYEAEEITLIGIAEGKDPDFLYTKKFERENLIESMRTTVQNISKSKDKLIEQLDRLQQEVKELSKEKESIEDVIRNTNYSFEEQTEGVPNELIRLKYILNRIADTKFIIETLEPLRESISLIDNGIKIFKDMAAKQELDKK